MNTEDLLRRVDELLNLGNTAVGTCSDRSHVDQGIMMRFRSGTLSFMEGLLGKEHSYYREFDARAKDSWLHSTEAGIGILHSLRDEIAGGWLFTLRGLIAAELFTDFLEMAEHYLSLGHKDPAAVMCGGVLEEHLRQLCIKNGIEVEAEKNDRLIPKKADRLNADLAKADVYSKLDQKTVTAWLDLRNLAAHGKYDEYTQEQVRNMLTSVTEFMTRIAI